MNQTGYNPKELNFGPEGRSRLISGIETISKAVKSTLGPRGNTVIIESPEHTHSLTVTKDGVTVAKSIQLLDPVENIAVRMMKEAADRTATSAGDGTTTAIVLTEAIVKSAIEVMEKYPNCNQTEVLRELVNSTNVIVEKLKKMSKPVTPSKVKQVATISANNDEEIGSIIAEVYENVGENGIVTVEKSKTHNTYYESTEGVKVDRGYSNPLFINNHKKDECILENPYVFVSDAEITNVLNIENILKPVIAENKSLLIIAPCSQNVLNTLAANVMKRGLKICVVPPPNFGYKQHELMQDIALSTGSTYFSEKTGDDLSIIDFPDLGRASKVIVGRDSTIILSSEEKKTDEINKRVEELWGAHKLSNDKIEREFIMSRIASLTGGIGVIYVGGKTDLEQKELYDRVDDAVCAVRSAMKEGILPGAGRALHQLSTDRCLKNANNLSAKIADAILSKAISAPLQQILENAGLKHDAIYKKTVKSGHGYDVKKEKYGNLISLGVIDPMKVTKNALQNAVSVAVTILSTNAIITMARTYDMQ
jgi:chaperonin GroEL